MIATAYEPTLARDRSTTEDAIEFVRTQFASIFSRILGLQKVSAPIAVQHGTGINDDLNGIEQPVRFALPSLSEHAEIVHSLAKWKRLRLMEYGIPLGSGIYTDMRALRPHEDVGVLHSMYVDQWDWERHIASEQRTVEYLQHTVRHIYSALKETEESVASRFPALHPVLPPEITCIHTEELRAMYPAFSPKEREHAITRAHGAVFLMGIGGVLSNGEVHDGRAPDYDDWSTPTHAGYAGLNGDILVWNPVLQCAMELSSMGIRVDKEALLRQLLIAQCEQRATLHFHSLLLEDKLPQSIGGGIGQSRVCMFLLRKAHIGEVHVGLWPEAMRQQCLQQGIHLL